MTVLYRDKEHVTHITAVQMLEISDMIVLFLDRYLRREPEVGVDLDLRGPVRSARQRLHIRLEHVLAQGDPHLQPQGKYYFAL